MMIQDSQYFKNEIQEICTAIQQDIPLHNMPMSSSSTTHKKISEYIEKINELLEKLKNQSFIDLFVLYERIAGDLLNRILQAEGFCTDQVQRKKLEEIKQSVFDKNISEYKKQFDKIENAKEKDVKTLYRFMPINENTYKHFKSEKLYLTNPKKFNDPYDCILFKFNNIRTQYYNRIGKLEYKLPVIESLLDKDIIRVRCFNEGSIEEIPKDWHLMMSHYAQDHKGIIVEYKFNAKNIKNKNLKFLKVHYTQNIFDSLDMQNNVSKKNYAIIETGLKNKAGCWKYEKEYRFAYWRDNKDSREEIPLEELGLEFEKIIFLVNTEQTDKDNIINSLNIDFDKQKGSQKSKNKIFLKSGAEIEIKQVVMKNGGNIEFEIVDQDIDFDTQRLKAS